MTPQLLIVGHIVKDIQPDGWQPGGGALYAAAQAMKLGVDAAVVTACDADIQPATLVPGVEWHVVRVERAIQFENTYAMGKRTQRVTSQSSPLGLSDVPEDWRKAPVVLLTPVFHDVEPAVAHAFAGEGAMLGIGAQGWLRRLDGDRALPGVVEAAPSWLRGSVVFVSEEDVAEADSVAQWRAQVPVVVLTRGSAGYTLWDETGRHDIQAFPSCEKDPTGAGDVFATAFLVRFSETNDVLESARFAAAAAAIAVEGAGPQAVGTRSQIEARLAAGVGT